MIPAREQFERLLRGAAQVRRPLASGAPFGVESKTIAFWRSLPGGEGDLYSFLLPLLRRAALCACLLMLLSIAFSYRALLTSEEEDGLLANATVDLNWLP